ncbi:MAG: ATP-binding cassette domain-containing protein [Planctomycetes bacterium]|nr:ATP-binding cassette domain-containing protein [Planctomycetota bacterium]
MHHQAPTIILDNANIRRPGGDVVLRTLSWTIHEGETWAIVGGVGSGKSTLAEALAGKMQIEGGSIDWPFIDRLRESGRVINWIAQVVQRVSFKEESRLFSYSRHYYQQRFNFIEPDDDLSLDAFLRAGNAVDDVEIERVCHLLGLNVPRDLSLIKLSNGQTRRARIARALLGHPEMLILDEPFMGLDVAGRAEVAAALADLLRHGTRLLLNTAPESIPDWVTHVIDLDNRWQGKRADFVGQVSRPVSPNLVVKSVASSKPIIEMSHVNVGYGDRPILRDVNWCVREGERWALLGPNGSGKTTLLSLIAGDHPQAYSNKIILFGKQRGTGETIWDIKRNVGLVSPELHLYFSEPLTAFRAAATGFFDVLAFRATTAEQDIVLHDLFERFGILDLAERPFGRLSTGQQRLVLLIRALVKAPPLLILDEPFQGLDGRLIETLKIWLDTQLKPEQSLIFVTHRPEEIPSCVTRRLRLHEGRVIECE